VTLYSALGLAVRELITKCKALSIAAYNMGDTGPPCKKPKHDTPITVGNQSTSPQAICIKCVFKKKHTAFRIHPTWRIEMDRIKSGGGIYDSVIVTPSSYEDKEQGCMAWVYPIIREPSHHKEKHKAPNHSLVLDLQIHKENYHLFYCKEGSVETCVSRLLERYRKMFFDAVVDPEALAYLLGYFHQGGEFSNEGLRCDTFGKVCVLAAKLEYASFLHDVARWIDHYGPTLSNVVQFELLLKENPKVALVLYGNIRDDNILYSFDKSNASVVPQWGSDCIAALTAEYRKETVSHTGGWNARYQWYKNLMSKLSKQTALSMLGVDSDVSNYDNFVQWTL